MKKCGALPFAIFALCLAFTAILFSLRMETKREILFLKASDGTTACLQNLSYDTGILVGEIVLSLPVEKDGVPEEVGASLSELLSPTLHCIGAERALGIHGMQEHRSAGENGVPGQHEVTLRFSVRLWANEYSPEALLPISLHGFDECFLVDIENWVISSSACLRSCSCFL